MSNPRQRNDLIIDEVQNGYLVRIPDRPLVSWLNRTARTVLAMCTGTLSAQEIASAHRALFDLSHDPIDEVERALHQLNQAGLVSDVPSRQDESLHLLVAIWAPSASVPREAIAVVNSMLNQLAEAGVRSHLVVDPSEDRSTARNRALSAAVVGEQYSHVLLLDATPAVCAAVDQVSVARILRSEHELVGIPVSLGAPDWERVAWADLPDPRQLRAVAHQYNVSFDGLGRHRKRDAGFVEARYVGPEAMVLRTDALARMTGTDAVERYRGVYGSRYTESFEHLWGFFDPMSTSNGMQLLGDVAFCERWSRSGGTLMVDITGQFGDAIAAARSTLRAAPE